MCYKKISNNLYICEIQSKVDVSHSDTRVHAARIFAYVARGK